MNALETKQLSTGKRILFCVINVLIPGLGFLFKRDNRAAALNFFGFIVFLFVSPFLVGHENQTVVPYMHGFAMLASGLICWGEP